MFRRSSPAHTDENECLPPSGHAGHCPSGSRDIQNRLPSASHQKAPNCSAGLIPLMSPQIVHSRLSLPLPETSLIRHLQLLYFPWLPLRMCRHCRIQKIRFRIRHLQSIPQLNSQSIKRLCVPSSFLLLLRSPTVTVVNICYFSCRIMFIFHFKQISENEKIDEERFTLPSSSTFSSGAKHLCLCLIDMRNSEFRRLKIRLPVLPNPAQMNACSMIFKPLLKVLLPRLYSLPFPHMSVHKGLQIWTL